jgi:hypothetical protein
MLAARILDPGRRPAGMVDMRIIFVIGMLARL